MCNLSSSSVVTEIRNTFLVVNSEIFEIVSCFSMCNFVFFVKGTSMCNFVLFVKGTGTRRFG